MKDDLISRQAAIEIVEGYNKSHMLLEHKPMLGAASIIIELNELPSAQPENKELVAWQEDFRGYIKMLNLPNDDYKGIMEYINEVPSAHRLHITGYIPEAWIEDEIEWLRRVGNHFASFAAMNIEAMLKRWREQQESEEDKDGRGR